MASLLKVTNLTRARVSLDSSIPSLQGLESRSIELTVAEIEDVRESLGKLAAASIITWSVSNTVAGDADAQFVTLADLQTGLSTTEAIDIYVNASSGSDGNVGSLAFPLETYAAAVAKVPSFIKHTVTIHLAPHPGQGYELATIENKSISFGAAIHVTGDNNFNELKPSAPALVGSSDVAVVSAGLVVDAFLGKTIEVLSGAALGDRRSIRNNTATSIIPVRAFTAPLAAGDTYRIVEPEVALLAADQVFSSPTASDLIPAVRNCPGVSDTLLALNPIGIYGPSVVFSNLRIRAAGPLILSVFSIINSPVVFYGVETVADAGFYLQLAVDSPGILQSGMDRSGFTPISVFPMEIGSAPNNTSWAGWGLSTLSRLVTGVRRFVGYLCSAYGVTVDSAEWRIHGGSFQESSTSPGRSAAVIVLGSSRARFDFSLPLTLLRSSQDAADRACLNVLSGAYLELSFALLEKTNQGSGIVVESTSSGIGGLPGEVGIGEGVVINGVTGVTSPDFGISVSGGSNLRYRATLAMSGWPVGQQLAIRSRLPGSGSTVESQDLTYLTSSGEALPSVAVSDGRYGWIRRL